MASISFAPLRHRSFSLSLISSLLSSTGTWMQSVAMGVYLTETTHNPVWLGLLMMAAWMPSLIGAPIGGAMSDRKNRQRWIQGNNIIMAVGAGTLAVLEISGHLHPIFAVLLAVVEGLASSASWAAWQSLLPDLVDRDEVLAAVSLSSAQFNLGRIIGPLLAGVVLAATSPGWCFAANAASFVCVVVLFAFVRTPDREPRVDPLHLMAEIRHGARAAWSQRACRHAIIGIGLVAFFLSPFIALIPAMAIQVLHAGRAGTPWLVTAQGVGAVLGAITLPALARRRSRLGVLRASLLGLMLSLIAYALAPSLWWSVPGLVLVGYFYIGTLTGLNASVQLNAPAAERSRILSLYTMSLSIFYPLGSLVQALLVHALGLRAVTALGALVGLALALGIFIGRPQYFNELAGTDTRP